MVKQGSRAFRLAALLGGWRILLGNALAFVMLLLLTFTLLYLLPGDPLDALYGTDLVQRPDVQTQERLRVEQGLAGLLHERLWLYLTQVLRGDLGFSALHAAPVSELIRSSLPWSLALVLLSVPLSLLLGVLPGLSAGSANRPALDQGLIMAAALLSSLPSFALALLLLGLFSVQLGWFPAAGSEPLFSTDNGWRLWLGRLWHACLPILVLSLHGALRFFYLSRGLARQISERPFIAAAQARGVGYGRLLWCYYWPNAWPEILARMTGVLPSVLGATLFVETVFSYPGIGLLLLNAIHTRDFPLLQGVIVSLGFVILLVNSLIDLAVLRLNQRG